MKITPSQREILESLVCERLSSNEDNLRNIEKFCNYRNSSIVDVLLNSANEEDENGSIAYYLVKEPSGEILFFFSLKCGLLFDEFLEGERLKEIHALCKNLIEMRNSPEVSENDKKIIDTLLEQTRAKKGIKKVDVERIIRTNEDRKKIEELFPYGMKNVGKTYSGVEIVHFCANDEVHSKSKWKAHQFNKKLGAVVFWQFIVPKVLSVMEHVGCEYLYLFAADNTVDESLVNYYRSYMNFRTGEEHGTAIPLYDFACKFMYQRTIDLDFSRNRFFESFNDDENAV